jgi:hypothetical protein
VYVQDAWHCALYDQHPEEYGRRIAEFVDLHFKEDEQPEDKAEEQSLLTKDKARSEEAADKIQEVSDALTQDEGTTTVTTEEEAQVLQDTAGAAIEQ